MNPEFLDVDDVLDLHAFLIEQDGGSVEVRDAGLLESAVAQPQVGFGGELLHSDLFEMAAASLFHLAKNHPFVDGNKRTALQAALVFLEINGHPIDRRTPLLYDLTMDVT